MGRGKNNVIVFSIIVALVTILYLTLDYFPSKKLSENHRYTVATIVKITYPSEGGPSARIDYVVKNKHYSSFFDFNWDDKNYVVGKRMYISFNPDDPEISSVIFDTSVPDTLTIIPPEGWIKIP